MKKALVSAAALACALPSFFGVANVSAEEKVTLDFAAIETAYGTKLWPEIIEAYKQVNPNVDIKLTMEKELEDAITPRLQSGDYPDVVLLAQSRKKALPETLIKDKALADLTDVLDMKVPGEDKTVKEKLLPGFTDSTSTNPYNDGKTYLMPMFYSPTGLFYNKALFKAKGWEVPKTWDQMWKLAEEAKKENIALFTYPTAGYLDTFFSSVIYSAGGAELFNTEATTVANANKDGFTKNQQAVLDNKALFMPNGSWVVDEMKDAPRADGFEWGMAAVPTLKEGGKQYAYTFLEHIWIPKEAKQQKAAKEFIAFLYSDKAAEIFAKHGAVQPVKGLISKLPAEKQVFYKVYDEGVLPGLGGFVSAEAIEGVDLKATLYEAFNSVVSGDLSVKDWQSNVVEVMKQFHDSISH